MSSNASKHDLEGNIREISGNVLLSNRLPDDIDGLLTRATELTAFYRNAVEVGTNVTTFNTSNPDNKINTAQILHVITLIIEKLLLIHDKFNRNRNTIVNSTHLTRINNFNQSKMIKTLLRKRAQQRAQSPRRPSVGSPIRRLASHIDSPLSSPPVVSPAVVSPANVIVNQDSSNEQPGCFGRLCRSIKSRFSRNSVHPGSNVGGKRKLRRRTRRTRRSRGRRSRLN
jgi:hypothetical protein